MSKTDFNVKLEARVRLETVVQADSQQDAIDMAKDELTFSGLVTLGIDSVDVTRPEPVDEDGSQSNQGGDILGAYGMDHH